MSTQAKNTSVLFLITSVLCFVCMVSNSQTEDTKKPQTSKSETKVDSEAEPAKVEIKRSSKAARAKGEITFDDLTFQIEKDAPFADKMITDDIKELDNKTVKLRGYILPTTLFSDTNIKQFVLVRDNQECCFGPGAALYDCVMIEMVPGKTTDFVTRPVTVEGKMKIDTKRYKYPGGKGPRGASHMAVFRIEGQKVK